MTAELAKWFTADELARLQPLLKKATVHGRHHWIRIRSDYRAVLEGCYFGEDANQRFVIFARKFVVQVTLRFGQRGKRLDDGVGEGVVAGDGADEGFEAFGA